MNVQLTRYTLLLVLYHFDIVWDNPLFHNIKYFIYNSTILHVILIWGSHYYNYSIDFLEYGYSAISFKSIQFIGIKIFVTTTLSDLPYCMFVINMMYFLCQKIKKLMWWCFPIDNPIHFLFYSTLGKEHRPWNNLQAKG